MKEKDSIRADGIKLVFPISENHTIDRTDKDILRRRQLLIPKPPLAKSYWIRVDHPPNEDVAWLLETLSQVFAQVDDVEIWFADVPRESEIAIFIQPGTPPKKGNG